MNNSFKIKFHKPGFISLHHMATPEKNTPKRLTTSCSGKCGHAFPLPNRRHGRRRFEYKEMLNAGG